MASVLKAAGRVTQPAAAHVRAMASDAQKVLRWGIISAGKISNDFTLSLKHLQSPAEHEVAAVAARQLDRAQEFATKHGIPKAYGSYKEISEDPDIDVMYIGSIHSEHHDLSIQMLNAGKHVVCEKPSTINGKELREVLQLAKEKNLFFMEGVWSRFFPVYGQIRKEIRDGTIGEVKCIECSHGQDISFVERARKKELNGGALLDLGIYCVQLAVMVLGQKPEKIVAAGHLFEEGSDECETITLLYKDNRMASLMVSAGTWLPNKVYIIGTKGTLEIPNNFWCPDTLITPHKTYHFPLPKRPDGMKFINSEGFVYEQQAVRQAILEGETEARDMSLGDSEAIMSIMDASRAQLGVVYSQDLEG